MRLALLALLVGCDEPSTDTDGGVVERVTVTPTVADYDCGQPANGGTQKVQLVLPADVMFTAELCGVVTSEGEDIDMCQQFAIANREGENVTIYCTARAPVHEETAFIRLWTIPQ